MTAVLAFGLFWQHDCYKVMEGEGGGVSLYTWSYH